LSLISFDFVHHIVDSKTTTNTTFVFHFVVVSVSVYFFVYSLSVSFSSQFFVLLYGRQSYSFHIHTHTHTKTIVDVIVRQKTFDEQLWRINRQVNLFCWIACLCIRCCFDFVMFAVNCVHAHVHIFRSERHSMSKFY
jgi:hypothetical protein